MLPALPPVVLSVLPHHGAVSHGDGFSMPAAQESDNGRRRLCTLGFVMYHGPVDPAIVCVSTSGGVWRCCKHPVLTDVQAESRLSGFLHVCS